MLSNWNPHMTYIYKNQCEGGTRTPLVVTVKKRPESTIIKGVTFQGQFRNGDPVQIRM